MDFETMVNFLNRIYMVNDIPICVFRNDELKLQLPAISYFPTRIQKYIDILKERHTKISYLMTDYDAFYGLIHFDPPDEISIFVGPFFTTPVSKEDFERIMENVQLPDYAMQDAKALLQYVPTGSLSRFLCFLTVVYGAITQEMLDIEDIIFSDTSNQKETNIDRLLTDSRYKETASESKHTTFLHEMYRIELVARGDVVGMEKNVKTMLPGKQGQIGKTALRQAKNIFIAGCTLYTRAAIAGGMDIEEAYTLSDIYINTCEECTSVTDVERLHMQMPLDFTKRVEQASKLDGKSAPIVDAIRFIEENINQPIQASDIAEHVNLSTSYFLKKFKAELGIGVSEYITKTKIKEACLLLTYTEKSLTEISNDLYFSSQSYFQNVFKKQTGMTPNQYRNKQTIPKITNRPIKFN